MANHHRKDSSKDIFSFPSTPSQEHDSDFEFGCFTPDSPSTDPSKNSPADRLFFNGRLLPHSFPPQSQQATNLVFIDSISRATSRTSSVSSNYSLMSSRSNSTNSSRSSVSVSSARTSASASENSERRLLYHSHSTKAGCKTPMASKVVMGQLYGSSQRWQHIMPVPVLKREDSQRKNCGSLVKNGLGRSKKQVKEGKEERPQRPGLCRRFFRSFLVACRECHAMGPSTKDDVLQGNVKL